MSVLQALAVIIVTARLAGAVFASLVVPFILGAALARLPFDALAPVGVPLMSFQLFLGVAMSITAFPVLARILADRGMQKTRLGMVRHVRRHQRRTRLGLAGTRGTHGGRRRSAVDAGILRRHWPAHRGQS